SGHAFAGGDQVLAVDDQAGYAAHLIFAHAGAGLLGFGSDGEGIPGLVEVLGAHTVGDEQLLHGILRLQVVATLVNGVEGGGVHSVQSAQRFSGIVDLGMGL